MSRWRETGAEAGGDDGGRDRWSGGRDVLLLHCFLLPLRQDAGNLPGGAVHVMMNR